MRLKFKLCEASSFNKSKKVESLMGFDFTMEEIKAIGENFTMEFEKEKIKDKIQEIFKDKSGGVHKSRLCLVGVNGVYIIEYLGEESENIKGQITMEEYVKGL